MYLVKKKYKVFLLHRKIGNLALEKFSPWFSVVGNCQLRDLILVFSGSRALALSPMPPTFSAL